MNLDAAGALPHCPVLVVEDSIKDYQSIAAALVRAGGDVGLAIAPVHAETYDAARELVMSRHFCMAVVDLVLDSDTASDWRAWEGFHFVEKVIELGLGEHLPVVIVSDHTNPDAMRGAFLSFGVADFLSKKLLSGQIEEGLKGLLRRSQCFGLHTNVELPDDLNWPLIVHKISRGRVASLAALITPEQAHLDLEHVTRSLFADCVRVRLQPIEDGASSAGVFLAERELPDGTAAATIAKLAEASVMRAERDGYLMLCEFLQGARSTRVVGGAMGTYYGGLQYSLVGAGERVEKLASFYEEQPPERVLAVLRALFLDICGLTYRPANRRVVEDLDLVHEYARGLHLDLDRLRVGWEFKFGERLDQSEQYHNLDVDRTLPNAVYAVAIQGVQLLTPSFLCRTHGDLHSRNLFVSPDDLGSWLFDFGSAGWGHWARDLVMMEADVRFRLLEHGELSDLLALEEMLLSGQWSGGSFSVEELPSAALRKAARVIIGIRDIAKDLVSDVDPAQAFVEYQAGLLVTSLRYFVLHQLLSRQKWRKHQVMVTTGVIWEWLRGQAGVISPVPRNGAAGPPLNGAAGPV